MIADMMLFAKPPALQPTAFELCAFLRELVGQLSPDLPSDVQLTHDFPPGTVWLDGDTVQLTVALRAIWSNAVEAMGDRGTLHLVGRVRLGTALGEPTLRGN